MADRKPPRLQTNELETLHALLQFQRDSMVRKVAGLDDEAARQTPVPSGTNLLWLVKHLTAAEVRWVLYRFAGQDVDIPDETVEPGDTLLAAVDAYRATWPRVDAAIAGTRQLDERSSAQAGDPAINLRWVVTHLLEETARHAGHADILRELIDGETGR